MRFSLVLISLFLLMHTGYNYRDYEALLSAAINSKLDQKRRENEKFREDIQNIKISSTSLHDKFDRIIFPYLSPKNRARRRLDDTFVSQECTSNSSTPFKICLSKPVPVKDIYSTLSTVLTLEYDSGVEDFRTYLLRGQPGRRGWLSTLESRS